MNAPTRGRGEAQVDLPRAVGYTPSCAIDEEYIPIRPREGVMHAGDRSLALRQTPELIEGESGESCVSKRRETPIQGELTDVRGRCDSPSSRARRTAPSGRGTLCGICYLVRRRTRRGYGADAPLVC